MLFRMHKSTTCSTSKLKTVTNEEKRQTKIRTTFINFFPWHWISKWLRRRRHQRRRRRDHIAISAVCVAKLYTRFDCSSRSFSCAHLSLSKSCADRRTSSSFTNCSRYTTLRSFSCDWTFKRTGRYSVDDKSPPKQIEKEKGKIKSKRKIKVKRKEIGD